jgi:hypothetical protein
MGAGHTKRPPRVSSKAAFDPTLGYPRPVRRVGAGGREFSACKHYSGAFGSAAKARIGHVWERKPPDIRNGRGLPGTFAKPDWGTGVGGLGCPAGLGSMWEGEGRPQESEAETGSRAPTSRDPSAC